MTNVEMRSAGETNWQEIIPEFEYYQHAYVADALIVPDEDGGFWACVPELPGTVSQGDTEEEAWTNIAEALTGVIESHVDAGEQIPWVEATEEVPPQAKRRRIVVHATVADSQRRPSDLGV
jgi:antitoxin HicB